MKILQTLLLAPILLVPLACSSGGGGGGAKGSTVLPANPAGIPLPGMPTDSAAGAVRTMVPTPVDPGDIVGRVFATRLHAILEPGATVGEVNDALVARGMSVVSMLEGVPMLVLRMPPVADEAAALAAAAELETTSAFAYVSACLAPPSAPAPSPRVAEGSSEARAAPSGALLAMRMPAAQNADGVILFDSSSVFVPCYFPDAAPDPRFSNMTMLSSEGGTPSFVFEYYLNWGLQAAGVIGVDATYNAFDPIDPGAPLYGMDIGYLTTMERVWEISGALQRIDSRTLAHAFVLCTTLTYDDPAYDILPPVERATEAYVWRSRLETLGVSGSDFVHFTAAGDTYPSMGGVPDASTNSPYALSESYPDLVAYLRQTAGDEVADDFGELLFGTIPPPVGNLRIVGSSTAGSHAQSTFSVPGEELRAVGEGIVAPCSTMTGMCDGQMEVVSSSRMACAEVAGLAGYLAQLSPSRTPAELLTLIDFAYFGGEHPGVVDAYMATLGLDRSIQDPQVRAEILDVAAGQDAFDEDGNGRFDEHDLKVFLDAFATSNDLRFDLNGDGTVGGLGTARFDLDVQSPPQLASVSIQGESGPLDFDELEVTDLDILCYYAYSRLYVGDTTARGILLADCGGGGPPSTTISVLSASRSVYAYAHALDSFQEDRETSDDTLAFNGAASASTAATAGATAGQANATANQQSSMSTDVYGNLVDITAGGSGNLSGTLTNSQGPFDYLQASSVTNVITDIVVADGTAHMECQMNYDASLGSKTSAFFKVQVGALVETDQLTLEGGDQTGTLTLSGDLPPGVYNITASALLDMTSTSSNN